MKSNRFRNIAISILVALLAFASGCATNSPTTTTSQTSSPPTTSPPITGTTGVPGVQVVAVALDRTITQNPGGPTIVIEFKNISAEAIVSLDVKVYEPNFAKFWPFDFGVSQASLFLPGSTISHKQTLIGPSGWGTGIPYFVTIAGIYSSGATFSFRFTPPGDGDFNGVTAPH